VDAALPGRVHLNGPAGQRLPNTLNLSIDGIHGHDLLAAAPTMAASTGSACHSGTHAPSPVLTAMGLDTGRALGAVRLSLGRWSTGADIETVAAALISAALTVSHPLPGLPGTAEQATP
jgi:cysteine desulfurase